MSKKINQLSKPLLNQNKYSKEIFRFIIKKQKQIKNKTRKMKFERLEIIAELATPICIYDKMHFDGFFTYAYKRYVYGKIIYDTHLIDNGSLQVAPVLPLYKNKGIYFASIAYYDILHEQTNKWRKRFDEHYAERYASSTVKIPTDRGKFKDYNQKIKIITTDQIKWIVVGNKHIIKKTLEFLPAIGKKTSQGYGVVKKWKIRNTSKPGERYYPVQKSNTFNTFKYPYLQSNKASFVALKNF